MNALDHIARNVTTIRAKIAAAARRVGRDPEGILLMAAAKNRSTEQIAAAARCGVSAFGENRVQEAKQKIPRLPAALRWEMIGHLQTNKVKDAVMLFRRIQTVDSERLLDEIERRCALMNVTMPILLEVNLAGEETKFGMTPADVEGLARLALDRPHVRVEGLMTMAPFVSDPETVRPVFRGLRELRDRVAAAIGQPLPELSMGMTQDYVVAVEEGATVVRIGTALFEPQEAH